MFHTAPETVGQLEKNYDRYGDSYFEATSPAILKQIFNSITLEVGKFLHTTTDLLQLGEEKTAYNDQLSFLEAHYTERSCCS